MPRFYRADTDLGPIRVARKDGKLVVTRYGLVLHRGQTDENALRWLAKHKTTKLIPVQ